ncbi:hypothetical protein H7K33_14460 [Mycobacterium paraense]|nr:hypothetical protein [Mycobacterium paraense]
MLTLIAAGHSDADIATKLSLPAAPAAPTCTPTPTD